MPFDVKKKKKKKPSKRIKVAVRVRPLSRSELKSSEYITRTTTNGEKQCITVFDPSDGSIDPVDVLHRSYERTYRFQQVFDRRATQEEIHRKCTQGLAEDVLFHNHNATVLAYGATGSGKTYTMLGTDSAPGIISYVMKELFEASRDKKDVDISVSYLEIYNENIRDLLVQSRKKLQLRQFSSKSAPAVIGLSSHRVRSVSALMSHLYLGNSRRRTEGTSANAVSSRSHAIFQVIISRPGEKGRTRTQKINLVDLAGSERASQTNNRGSRLREGAKINRSLLSLANCINAIVAGRRPSYRDSKLTRLLKDSLGGSRCRTVMLATIRPHVESFRDTLNTLKYASRASCIASTTLAKRKGNEKRLPNVAVQHRSFGVPAAMGVRGRPEYIENKRRREEVKSDHLPPTPLAHTAARPAIRRLCTPPPPRDDEINYDGADKPFKLPCLTPAIKPVAVKRSPVFAGDILSSVTPKKRTIPKCQSNTPKTRSVAKRGHTTDSLAHLFAHSEKKANLGAFDHHERRQSNVSPLPRLKRTAAVVVARASLKKPSNQKSQRLVELSPGEVVVRREHLHAIQKHLECMLVGEKRCRAARTLF